MPGPRVLGCLPEEAERVRRAAVELYANLAGGWCGLEGLDGLKGALLALLSGRRPLVVRCGECEGLPASGFTIERKEIGLCRSLFTLPQERIPCVLFHELIHACGGHELDAEALECHCFGPVSTPPSRRDLRLFSTLPARGGYYLGTYVMWSPADGRVCVRTPGTDLPGAVLRARFLPTGS